MPVIERRFALRVAANLTAFLRFDAGLVRGPEPREGGLARARRLTRRMRELHEREEGLRLALDESKKLLAETQWQLQNKQERLAELEAAASGVPQRWKWTNYIVVSSEHRFIYLRVPKVASTSMLLSRDG